MHQLFLVILFLALNLANTYGQLSIIFSLERGIYDSSFQLALSTDDPTAEIRFTIDGKTPSTVTGTLYTGPITIDETTVVKALAFSSSETTMVKAHTYVFIQDVIDQPTSTAGFTTNTGFSTTIKNDGTYGPMLDDALADIAFMSLSLDLTDYNFIYTTKGVSRQAHIEFYDELGSESYDRPTGVSTYGNSSFSFSGSDKKNYRLRFKEEFGASKFEFAIFGNDAAKDFDVIDLRAGSQETFDRGGIQNLHEKILKDAQIALSGNGVHGRVVHLYINAVYWGVYTLSERPAKAFGESYFGGDKDDYNTMKATCCVHKALPIDGTDVSYINMKSQLVNYPNVEDYIDVDHFIDYVMLCNYGPHGDWKTWNTYAIDNPTAGEPYRFFMWDPEPSLKNDWYHSNKLVNTFHHQDIWLPLKAHEDFRVRVGDHMECNCEEDDGPLNPINFEAYYDDVFQRHKLAYLAEAARWANKNLYNDFLDYRDDLINTSWFFNRKNLMKAAYKDEGLYPDIDAVNFDQAGGFLPSASQLNLSNPNLSGSIYYTLDGTDPRAPGGAISSDALLYNGTIDLNSGVYIVSARIKVNNQWSAMCPKKFYVDQDYNNLVINEIHYNPQDSIIPSANDTIDGGSFEFIEIKNCGVSPIDLLDVQFNSGITLRIDHSLIIEPDEFVVFAGDAIRFQEKYGFAADAEYEGKLSNGGESLRLVSPGLETIDSLDYDDDLPWPELADEGLYSLALSDCNLDNTQPANWSTQSVLFTPRAENNFAIVGDHPYSGIVINEIHYNPKDSIVPVTGEVIDGKNYEFVELKNVSSFPIDLSGSSFTEGIEYEFPDETIIQPGQFIVLAEDKSSFEDRYGFEAFDKYDGKLDNGGETLLLISQSGITLDLVTYDDKSPWDSDADGVDEDNSLALFDADLDNDIYLNWSVQCSKLYTPGAENDLGCFSAPDYGGLTINEIDHSPNGGDVLEFVELVNNSSESIELEGLSISDAINFDFHSGQLDPGEYLVITSDSTMFHNAYSIATYGDFSGALGAKGGTILLSDFFGNTVDIVSYGNVLPWTSKPSEGMHSLALVDPDLDNEEGLHWCIQDINRTPMALNSFADADGDGVFDCLDICPGSDDNIDADNNGIPDGCQDCTDHVVETTNSIIANDRSAGISLNTNGRVISGLDINYHAGQEIIFLQGFEVAENTVFRASIEGCN